MECPTCFLKYTSQDRLQEHLASKSHGVDLKRGSRKRGRKVIQEQEEASKKRDGRGRKKIQKRGRKKKQVSVDDERASEPLLDQIVLSSVELMREKVYSNIRNVSRKHSEWPTIFLKKEYSFRMALPKELEPLIKQCVMKCYEGGENRTGLGFDRISEIDRWMQVTGGSVAQANVDIGDCVLTMCPPFVFKPSPTKKAWRIYFNLVLINKDLRTAMQSFRSSSSS